MTATTDVVISEKSKLELASDDFNGIAVSRMSTMRMDEWPGCYSIRILASLTTLPHLAMSALM